jgi:hypothetical protein
MDFSEADAMSSSHDCPSSRFDSLSSNEEGTLTTPRGLEKYPYRDPSRLQEVFDQIGTIAGTASHFGIVEATARIWLIHYDIYDPETEGLTAPTERLEKLAPEDVGLCPLGERK